MIITRTGFAVHNTCQLRGWLHCPSIGTFGHLDIWTFELLIEDHFNNWYIYKVLSFFFSRPESSSWIGSQSCWGPLASGDDYDEWVDRRTPGWPTSCQTTCHKLRNLRGRLRPKLECALISYTHPQNLKSTFEIPSCLTRLIEPRMISDLKRTECTASSELKETGTGSIK